MKRALIITAALGFAATAFAEDEEFISLEDAPPAAMETALATAPGATFETVAIEREEGLAIYEFRGADYAGRKIEVDVLEDGSLQEIEMQIAMSEVPQPVIDVLSETTPGFSPTYVELSVRDNGSTIVYEFEGVLENQEVDVEVAESGELLFHGEDGQS